ncbi:Skp family chaperone for outer membrane proteins [Mesonia hippocampi]|uniref:Skp family chaperone for outer membrane proteins n=1 Tax=Mesonia hippocampi TaxID=1628250 RepID=A0A840ELJ5_9FLAO|nr:hypothetical protein [Mesonia hippocampi]MBB4118998.1 Skp family chaperone for outer membrane proteins [Mesonia hippocampi]
MKRIQKLALMIVGVAVMLSCNSNYQKSDINLNNGEKWTVNNEMKPHIEKGNALLDSFISQQDKDYLGLAKNLKAQNKALIKSCTMKGESHDELHKWLNPHMELIEALSNTKNDKDATLIVAKLENSFKTYNTYFQ